ncbi:hypothetical protein OESDEN_03272 [Oesophagostomum dentatum]|uniref:Uncharacterized protein n=1 Tax=Oesophagostomum dentatum TaxID=61180 RepID=A0A0B1TLR0_OESDE|nr:hypothetical protein OESDEN_03272 [Oesophagostomum dentatum]
MACVNIQINAEQRGSGRAQEIARFEFNINWTKLFQESTEPEYQYQGAKGNVSAPKEEKVLFKTTFTNTTQREQEYSFKTERCTRSTSTVIIEKGVCRGMEVALKLKTPCEVVEANAGFHQEVNLTHIGENTNEEELAWGVDSCVRVPPSCETVAELVILEEQCKRDFRIDNRMSGKVLVTGKNSLIFEKSYFFNSRSNF